MQPHPDLETEQAHLDLAYTRLDALRALARTRLEAAMRQGNEGTHQNRSERDSFTSLYTDRLAALDAVESRDAVANRNDAPHFGDVDVDGVAADLVADDLGNLFGFDVHVVLC